MAVRHDRRGTPWRRSSAWPRAARPGPRRSGPRRTPPHRRPRGPRPAGRAGPGRQGMLVGQSPGRCRCTSRPRPGAAPPARRAFGQPLQLRRHRPVPLAAGDVLGDRGAVVGRLVGRPRPLLLARSRPVTGARGSRAGSGATLVRGLAAGLVPTVAPRTAGAAGTARGPARRAARAAGGPTTGPAAGPTAGGPAGVASFVGHGGPPSRVRRSLCCWGPFCWDSRSVPASLTLQRSRGHRLGWPLLV